MSETKKKFVPQFRGLLFSMTEWSTKEIGVFMQRFEDRYGKPPTHMLVNANLDLTTIKLPEQYKGVEIQVKQYVHNKNVCLIGVWS